jgi:hypothetical protein
MQLSDSALAWLQNLVLGSGFDPQHCKMQNKTKMPSLFPE